MAEFVNAAVPQGSSTRALQQVLDDSRAAGESLALLVVNVDQLERVRGTLGHDATVALTDDFRRRVGQVLRERDKLFQIGERKFWVLLRALKNEGHALLAANKLRRIGKEPFRIDHYSLKLDASIGIALFPQHADNAAELVRRADLALLSAREDDTPVRVYVEESTQRIASLWEIESEFELALEESQLELFYQPKVDVETLQPCGAEALIRWRNPTRGLLAPVSFLAIAEHTRKLEAMTWFVIDAAQRQRAEWTQRWGGLPVSVNIPPAFLEIPQVAEHLKSSLQIWDSKPGDVVLEITEESVVRNPSQSFAVLAQMRQNGLRIAIDDFGTGYSSMAYFKEMPADEIKIDKSFVRNLPREIDNQHIVRAVIDLAHKFNYKVVAEGVETPEEFDVLRGMRCDIVQGFLYSRPQPHADFVQWLADYEVPES